MQHFHLVIYDFIVQVIYSNLYEILKMVGNLIFVHFSIVKVLGFGGKFELDRFQLMYEVEIKMIQDPFFSPFKYLLTSATGYDCLIYQNLLQ